MPLCPHILQDLREKSKTKDNSESESYAADMEDDIPVPEKDSK